MQGKPKKPPREKDLTSRYQSGDFDEDRIEQQEQFKERNKTLQKDKMVRTAELRAAEGSTADVDALPVGEVIQVHSLFSEVRHNDQTYLCVVRRTITRTTGQFVVVGDRVRFRHVESKVDGRPADAPPEGVIEQILPRKTLLTRSDSFKGVEQHPIVANAEQVLIVASIRQPYAKWGLIDRMLVAAQAGGLMPIVCLNKLDLAEPNEDGSPPDDLADAEQVLQHYAQMGVKVLRTSVERQLGLAELKGLLAGKATVLAGHSGVGKSSLVRAVQPGLDIRVGEVSRYTDKGRHTTTSARRYPLDAELGGTVIDTPGVKQFGLWGVTRDNLEQFFPDIAAGTAPDWRKESYDRIIETMPKENPYGK
jgi:ribosome biogenesis GTPase